jgi:hypothetical protein
VSAGFMVMQSVCVLGQYNVCTIPRYFIIRMTSVQSVPGEDQKRIRELMGSSCVSPAPLQGSLAHTPLTGESLVKDCMGLSDAPKSTC